MRSLAFVSFLAACTTAPGDEVVGPFTGATHRYAIDRYSLPLTHEDVVAFGDDLDGDGNFDNALGMVFGSIRGQGDLTTAASSMAAVGMLPSALIVQADSQVDDEVVGVSYIGRPGDSAVAVGGRFVGSRFVSNRVPRRALAAHKARSSCRSSSMQTPRGFAWIMERSTWCRTRPVTTA